MIEALDLTAIEEIANRAKWGPDGYEAVRRSLPALIARVRELEAEVEKSRSVHHHRYPSMFSVQCVDCGEKR